MSDDDIRFTYDDEHETYNITMETAKKLMGVAYIRVPDFENNVVEIFINHNDLQNVSELDKIDDGLYPELIKIVSKLCQ